MSELVQTLWFEDTRFLHEQMLDTPVGRFSIRQMGIFLVFGLLAWVVSLVFADIVLKIVVAGVIFVTGVALFTRKIKTVSPEAHLLCLIKRRFLQTTKQPRSVSSKSQRSVEQTSKSMVLSATLGVPLKIVGILKNFSGNFLADNPFQVHLNNNYHAKGVTDKEGYFCTYFTPDHPGLFQITIQPQNHPEAIQPMRVLQKGL